MLRSDSTGLIAVRYPTRHMSVLGNADTSSRARRSAHRQRRQNIQLIHNRTTTGYKRKTQARYLTHFDDGDFPCGPRWKLLSLSVSVRCSRNLSKGIPIALPRSVFPRRLMCIRTRSRKTMQRCPVFRAKFQLGRHSMLGSTPGRLVAPATVARPHMATCR